MWIGGGKLTRGGEWAWLSWGFRVICKSILQCTVTVYTCAVVLCCAHSQVYPEEGSKEVKEESCHHSRQALIAIEHTRMKILFMCHLRLHPLPYSWVMVSIVSLSHASCHSWASNDGTMKMTPCQSVNNIWCHMFCSLSNRSNSFLIVNPQVKAP